MTSLHSHYSPEILKKSWLPFQPIETVLDIFLVRVYSDEARYDLEMLKTTYLIDKFP